MLNSCRPRITDSQGLNQGTTREALLRRGHPILPFTPVRIVAHVTGLEDESLQYRSITLHYSTVQYSTVAVWAWA